ncbi:hypothetical protein [Kitasatospora sp. NPDC087315]|uniref:hypothetical protein n=1 Tax=Kitasatospora sp. NPDC087315 TaxID=3364069 RepID=UPI0037FBF355
MPGPQNPRTGLPPAPARCDRRTYTLIAAEAAATAGRIARGPLLNPAGHHQAVPAGLRRHPLIP